jgi:heme oxygenase (biliverdin-IX-beta and delta-forming)
MLLATAPDDLIGVETVRPSGLRGRLKDATAADHRELDARFATFDLSKRTDYRRFLEASAAALLPLEAALERDGVAGIFDDWAQRSRRAAIIADIDRLGGAIRPWRGIGPFTRHSLIGALYVLEGSRLGAKFLLRIIARSADPQVSEATAYLRHGAGQALWPSFLARLESEAVAAVDESEAITGARRAFALFAEAGAQA